ncbi:hypothetical protein UA38_11765 [Photobacterium kishitanii]|uniref:Uncharacterized protein n=1 Tax=Photobacterium kishitanii TaxID=318456 RepID=A0AAX0YWM9_9GAMM|nr:hypothetical protein [Photobacterium kishitanii]KJG57045.1 hypothetical protein UA38_11765 [Photobacterium kishitanii]KJG60569.1 hypothetical protein UA42_14550 [Photobacterium kishitanii]KJG64872.1 hypothetical protein UA40_14250 [Photobacterium kishitanii]KJG68508.1 hypothetical protein UA41_16660 [Photobacterium kishitanii]OBU31208.1 hypothetical protein AYY23_20055 [Photobacterium kishitanii]
MVQKYSRASDLGEAAKSPHSLYLQKSGSSISQQVQLARTAGVRDHDKLNQRVITQENQPKTIKSLVFILSCISLILGFIWVFG